MKIKLKARRISGNDPVTFRNPHGDPIMLCNIGDVSQELQDDFAYKLCAANSDILEVAAYEVKMAVPQAAKAVPSLLQPTAQAPVKRRAAEEALEPPKL